jgi:hypothetical protein
MNTRKCAHEIIDKLVSEGFDHSSISSLASAILEIINSHATEINPPVINRCLKCGSNLEFKSRKKVGNESKCMNCYYNPKDVEDQRERLALAERKLERALAGLQAIETAHDTYFVDRYGHTLTARTALSEIVAMDKIKD